MKGDFVRRGTRWTSGGAAQRHKGGQSWVYRLGVALFLALMVIHNIPAFAQSTCPRMDFRNESAVCPECPTPEPTYTPQPPTPEECLVAGVCPAPTPPAQPPQDTTCSSRTVTDFMKTCPRGTILKAGVASCCPTDQFVNDGAELGFSTGATSVTCCVSDPAPTATPNPASTPSACPGGTSFYPCGAQDYCCRNPDGYCYNGFEDPDQGITGYEGPRCVGGMPQWNCSGAFACDPITTPTPLPTTPTATATPVAPTPTNTPSSSGGSACQCAYDFVDMAVFDESQCPSFCQSGGLSGGHGHVRKYCVCTNLPGSSTCPSIDGRPPVRPNNNSLECPADGCLAFDCLLPRVVDGDVCPGQLAYAASSGTVPTCADITRSPSTSAAAKCNIPLPSGGTTAQKQDVSICYTSQSQ